MSNQSFKVKSGLTLTPVDLTTLVSPQSGDIVCDINDSNKLKSWNGSVWVEIGAGGGSGGTSSDYIIDQYISKTNSGTSALGLIYKRVKSATSLTSFQALMIDKSVPTSGNLTFDIKVGETPYALTSRFSGGSSVSSMAVQSDGKVILIGTFTSYNGKTVGRGIIRLNTNGSVDTTFAVGTGFNSGSDPKVVKILSDGSILVGGSFNNYNGTTVSGLCKLNSTGVIDTAFTSGRTFNVSGGAIWDIQVRPNGKIILIGDFATAGYAVVAKGLIQLNADGSYDSSFAAGNLDTLSFKFYQGLLMTDGSLFVVGVFSTYSLVSGTTYTVSGVVKLTSSGLKDATFTTAGTTLNVNTIVLHQSNIILGGDFGTSSFGGITASKIVKLDATTGAVIGSPTFTPPAGLSNIIKIEVASDNKLFVAPGGNMYKLNSDGTSDATFTGIISSVKSFAFASNGNLLVGGAFSVVNSNSWVYNGRINPVTGASDNTYDTLVSIFDTLPSFNFTSITNGDILNGVIARPSIPEGAYIKIDITVVPSTYVGSFYLTLY
jgi:uncharacterized delta-60 repeat protein